MRKFVSALFVAFSSHPVFLLTRLASVLASCGEIVIQALDVTHSVTSFSFASQKKTAKTTSPLPVLTHRQLILRANQDEERSAPRHFN